MKIETNSKTLGREWVAIARDRIKPNRSHLTEHDHEAARLRQILKMMQEEVAYLHYEMDPKNPSRKYTDISSAHKALGEILYASDGQSLIYPDGTDHGVIDDFCHYNEIFDHSVYEEHSGECTGELHECKVCYIEQFYDLKSEIKSDTVQRQRLWAQLYREDEELRSQMGFIRRLWRKIW